MTTQYEHVLAGCTPTPLASYLKALAVLRLVAEQAGDPNATGCWRNDAFVLRTYLAKDKVSQFFAEHYEPTPLLAPWNGGSGFFAKDNQDGIRPLAATGSIRFLAYRRAIEIARDALTRLSLNESPKNELKFQLLGVLRSTAPEGLLRWIDAAVILSEHGPAYPPLLGTGGNDGRLDFTNNFMQRLGDVFEIATGKPTPSARHLLEAAIYGVPSGALVERAIGQFAPGSAGGPNAASGFEGKPVVNPWDFILMLEGTLLLAASSVRRLEAASGTVLSAPFTVRSRLSTEAAGALSDDSDARGEIWMPIWNAYFTLDEVIALFAEGRAALGARPTRDGLDFARAVARLGVDRGISAFQRYGFLMRSGKAFLATPLTRVSVQRNPRADLIDELERKDWLARVQRFARDQNASAFLRTAAARLDAALFLLTQSSERAAVEKVLRQLGQIEALCGVNPNVREALGPLPTLSFEWVRCADDGSTEFQLAVAIAGLSLRGKREGKNIYLGFRPHLSPAALDESAWNGNSHLTCWSGNSLERSLREIAHRRRLEAIRLNAEGEFLRSRTGARLEDVHRFLDGKTDDKRIAELLWGLACTELHQVPTPQAQGQVEPVPAYALLKPFFTSESLLRDLDWLPPDRSLRLPTEICARLAADDVPRALNIAWHHLRVLGVKLPGKKPPSAAGVSGPRLLAALMVPLTFSETGRLLRWLDLAPESETPDELLDESA